LQVKMLAFPQSYLVSCPRISQYPTDLWRN